MRAPRRKAAVVRMMARHKQWEPAGLQTLETLFMVCMRFPRKSLPLAYDGPPQAHEMSLQLCMALKP